MTDPGTPPDQQFAALLSDLSSDNPGLQPSSATTIQVAGQTAQSAESVDPNANGGRGEHDWIVGLPGQDGLRYFVFVAPQPDFPAIRPTFDRMLQSVRVQGTGIGE
jgi:hypothetical protein